MLVIMKECSIKNQDRCPHCGGLSGIEYVARLVTLRHRDWDGSDVEVEVDLHRSSFPKHGKCVDCGKIVKLQ